MGERDAVSEEGTPPAPDADAPGTAAGRQQHVRRGWRRMLGPQGKIVVSGAVAVALTAVALTALGKVSSRADVGSHPLPAARNFRVPVLGHPGEHIALSDYAGKPVIVNFFASWCGPCKQETPLIARFSHDHSQVTVIGIDVSDPAAAALAFVRHDGVSYPVGVDPAMATAGAYGLRGLPQTFFLNASHRVAKRVAGPVTAGDLRAGLALITPGTKEGQP